MNRIAYIGVISFIFNLTILEGIRMLIDSRKPNHENCQNCLRYRSSVARWIPSEFKEVGDERTFTISAEGDLVDFVEMRMVCQALDKCYRVNYVYDKYFDEKRWVDQLSDNNYLNYDLQNHHHPSCLVSSFEDMCRKCVRRSIPDGYPWNSDIIGLSHRSHKYALHVVNSDVTDHIMRRCRLMYCQSFLHQLSDKTCRNIIKNLSLKKNSSKLSLQEKSIHDGGIEQSEPSASEGEPASKKPKTDDLKDDENMVIEILNKNSHLLPACYHIYFNEFKVSQCLECSLKILGGFSLITDALFQPSVFLITFSTIVWSEQKKSECQCESFVPVKDIEICHKKKKYWSEQLEDVVMKRLSTGSATLSSSSDANTAINRCLLVYSSPDKKKECTSLVEQKLSISDDHWVDINLRATFLLRKSSNYMDFKSVQFDWCHIGPLPFQICASHRIQRGLQMVETFYPFMDPQTQSPDQNFIDELNHGSNGFLWPYSTIPTQNLNIDPVLNRRIFPIQFKVVRGKNPNTCFDCIRTSTEAWSLFLADIWMTQTDPKLILPCLRSACEKIWYDWRLHSLESPTMIINYLKSLGSSFD